MEPRIDDLIEQLQSTTIGASPRTARLDTPFAPLLSPTVAREYQQLWPVFSEVQMCLIKRGAEALSLLANSLGDRRPTSCIESLPEFVVREDVCDENSHTDSMSVKTLKPGQFTLSSDKLWNDHPENYTATVGDLCFVVLGQIVNRRFFPVDHKVGPMTIVASPTLSERLRQTVFTRWRNMTMQSHRESLRVDLRQPDVPWRASGAAQRLEFYYREAIGG
jgi:hypothetical protein